MGDGLKDIIARLEQQKDSIDRALSALREIESIGGPGGASSAAPARSAPAKRKSHMSPEGRQRLIAALKRRWAAKRAAESAPAAAKKAAGKHARPTKAA